MPAGRTFATFMEEVRGSLDHHAERKGYNNGGTDGPNGLYDEGIEWGDEPAHSVGEARYKLRELLHEPREVLPVKVAAWMFLVWRAIPEFRSRRGLAPEGQHEVSGGCVR